MPQILSNSNSLTNISPIDGRYWQQVTELQELCSEAALIAYRVFIEIEWLKKIITITDNDKNILKANRFSGLAPIDPSSLEFPRGGASQASGMYKDIHEHCERKRQQSGKPKCEGYNTRSGDELHTSSASNQSIQNFLNAIVENFSAEDVRRIKAIEKATNHDVKAVEYFIKEKIADNKELKPYYELVHIGCTSEDINNLAYALMIKATRDQCLLPQLAKVIQCLCDLAQTYAATAMIAHTHGQPATPTTVGKECANFVARLQSQYDLLSNIPIMGKFNGATGNYSALYFAYPEHDWLAIAEEFVTDLGLAFNPYTTQIEPHDYIASFCHTLAHLNNILLNLCRDIWGYIALNYFSLKHKHQQAQPEGREAGLRSVKPKCEGYTQSGNKSDQLSTVDQLAESPNVNVGYQEVGSSTMPHKINPIDFENAEGNLGIANALLDHFATKLPISRWQRDLSDSTVLRNLGVSFAHSVIAYKALLKGLNKLEVNAAQLRVELDRHWEVLGEAIQTVMRRYGIDNPYEKLKALTRGQTIDANMLQVFINNLDLPPNAKQQLLSLTPHNYLGKAIELAKNIKK